MRGTLSLGVAQVAQNVAGMKQVRLGGMVVAGFDFCLALLLELAGVVELLAFDGIGGAAVAHVRELERHQPLRLDQVGRRRGHHREDLKENAQQGNRRGKSRGCFHRKGIVIEAIRNFQLRRWIDVDCQSLCWMEGRC
jgi:hypothetical protein